MSKAGIVLSSRVRLARNIYPYPFRPRMKQEQADECIERVLNALRDEPVQYRYIPMRGISTWERQALVEEHRISPDLFRFDDRGAAVVRADGSVVIMVNEEDHLRIQSFTGGLSLREAADLVFETEDSLQRRLMFSFDPEWGYLTACPTNAGTGMRASVLMHLPMLTLHQEMGQVTQLAAKLGLTIRGVYGEGNEALGHVYQLSNQVTLGKSEEELLEAVSATAVQIEEMEKNAREKMQEEDGVEILDQISRSAGLLQYAKKMSVKEFYSHWSNLRLAVLLGMYSLPLSVCDSLLTQAQDAHLIREAGHDLTEREVQIARCEKINQVLGDALRA